MTLPELLLAMTIVALIGTMTISQLHIRLDRIAARDAVRAAAAMAARARDEALAQRVPVTVRLDTAAARIHLIARGSAIATEPVGLTYGVRLAANREELVYDTRGLGYGAANLTLVARRGSAAETLVVSRLGRVRY